MACASVVFQVGSAIYVHLAEFVRTDALTEITAKKSHDQESSIHFLSKFAPVKQFLAVFFSCAFLLNMFSGSLILLNYELNTSYIIEQFCENRDRPELQCNGKCHLSKQLKADTEQRSEERATVDWLSPLLIFEHFGSATPQFGSIESETVNIPYQVSDYRVAPSDIFHPPRG